MAHFDMSGFAKIILGSGIPIYKPSFADILDWVVPGRSNDCNSC